MSSEETLASRFACAGITSAAIIDDAYDIPTVPRGHSEDLWIEIEDSPDLLNSFQSLGVELADATDIDEAVVADLWARRDESGPVRDACRKTLFRDVVQRLDDLDQLCACLATAGIGDIQRLGTQDGLPAPSVPLVFLDFSLDGHTPSVTKDELASGNIEEIVERLSVPKKSKELADRLWDGANPEKPFIVLISDHIEAGPLKDRFLGETIIQGGLYGFMSKPELRDPDRVLLRLASWGVGNTDCQAVQRFVTEAMDAVDKITDTFKNFIRQLGVHDYSHIQRMALLQEGHPLGDYLTWLFEGLLANEFRAHEGLRREQQAVDMLEFRECIPCDESTVGARLTTAYWKAQTIPVNRDCAHPWDRTENRPLHGLGDLYVSHNDKSAFVVVNAPCDLRFVPGKDSKRPWKPDLSVVLVPGTIEPQTVSQPKIDASTPFYNLQNRPHRIVWHVDRAVTVPNQESTGYLVAGYKRVCRLRPLHVLTIKMELLTKLSRLGTPCTPPLTDLFDVELLVRAGGVHVAIESPIKAACMVFSGKKKQFLLTTPAVSLLVRAIKMHLGVELENVEREIENLKPGSEHYASELNGKRTKKERLLSRTPNVLTWLKLAEIPQDLPNEGKSCDIESGLVKLFNADSAEPLICDTPIVVRIYPQPATTTPASECAPEAKDAGASPASISAEGNSSE